MKNKLRTCNSCGWVAFSVTRSYAKKDVKRFNDYFYSLTKKEQQDNYGGTPSSILSYERCFVCGTCHHNFRTFKKGDCPAGVTLQPIIYEKKNVRTRNTKSTQKTRKRKIL